MLELKIELKVVVYFGHVQSFGRRARPSHSVVYGTGAVVLSTTSVLVVSETEQPAVGENAAYHDELAMSHEMLAELQLLA